MGFNSGFKGLNRYNSAIFKWNAIRLLERSRKYTHHANVTQSYIISILSYLVCVHIRSYIYDRDIRLPFTLVWQTWPSLHLKYYLWHLNTFSKWERTCISRRIRRYSANRKFSTICFYNKEPHRKV